MIRLLSLFSGIGAFKKALDRIGAKYELVNLIYAQLLKDNRLQVWVGEL